LTGPTGTAAKNPIKKPIRINIWVSREKIKV